MTTNQQLDLDAIEARANAATPGPWGTYRDLAGVYTIQARPRTTIRHGHEHDGDIATLAAGRSDAESYANAHFITHAPQDVEALVAEVRRLRAQVADLGGENAKLIRWHREDGAYEQRLREQHDRDVADLNRLRARVWELERPTIEKQRGEIQLSMRQLAAQAREDGDYESEAIVLQRLAAREEQWKAEDAANQPAARSAGPDTLPAWLCQRFDPRSPGWDALGDDDRAYWEHHARAVRRAVARGGFKPAPVAQQPVAADDETGAHRG